MSEAPGRGDLILYATEDGSAKFTLRAEGGTVWLTQLELAELFQSTVPNINIHIKNLLAEGELGAEGTIKESLIVRTEGKRSVNRPVKLYNLDMILAVGYRVRSPRGARRRILNRSKLVKIARCNSLNLVLLRGVEPPTY